MPNVPEWNEFILYPNPKEVTSLPAERVRPFIFEQLDREGKSTPDFERTMGLGQLARRLNVPSVEDGIVKWLEAEPSPARYDAAGLFLTGYWPNREPAVGTVLMLLRGLDAYIERSDIRDSVGKALTTAFVNSTSNDLRRVVRDKFRDLRGRRIAFQDAVQTKVDAVVLTELPTDRTAP